MLPSSLQLLYASTRSKKELTTLAAVPRPHTELPILQMQQICPPPNLPIAIHKDLVRNLELSVLQPQHHLHHCLLKYLQGLCLAATSAPRANNHFPPIHCDKQRDFHMLPFSTTIQSTETWSSQCEPFSPCVCVAGASQVPPI